MIIFPAIDIQNGKVVRLQQGRFDEVTVYSDDPVGVALRWEKAGAGWLHLVDLDGALHGMRRNSDVILAIKKAVRIPVQTGGGIRTQNDITTLIKGGIDRVILGTKIIEDRTFLKTALKKWHEKIAVSLDSKNGLLAQRGWTKTSNVKATELAGELARLGLRCLIYTDITRDGMLSGPNIPALTEILKAAPIPVIASGGVASLEDIAQLIALKSTNLLGVITGKALYEGKFDLKEAVDLCSQNG